MNLGQSFDEVHGDVLPNGRGHAERLQQVPGLEMFALVALAHFTRTDKILDHHPIIGEVKIYAQAMQSLVDAFMSCAVYELQDGAASAGRRPDEHAPLEEDGPIYH
jgi:hypothetical protein